MQEVVNLYKPVGKTPLQILQQLREKRKEFQQEKMTYAGRLDPMTDGVLPILIGDAVHKKEEYTSLDKQYDASILLGIATDSYDVLGIVESVKDVIPQKGVMEELRRFQGMNSLSLPPYSSPPVDGKPLFHWARTKQLDKITVPKRSMIVHEVTIHSIQDILPGEVYSSVVRKIDLVQGDFRQAEVKKSWEQIESHQQPLKLVQATFHVASGTYIRSIAHTLGERLGCGAILYSLTRTSVGKMTLQDSIRLK